MDIKAIIFDIDGTLTEHTSWDELTTGLGASLERHQQIYQDFLAGRISYEESKARLITLWQATGKADRKTMGTVFDRIPLRPSASETMETLTRKGCLTCLITGSMDLFAESVSNKLGTTGWYANTHLVFDEADQLVDYNYHRDQSQLKISHLDDFCKRYSIKPDQCVVVGNGENDTGIFTATGNGIFFGTGMERVPKGVKHRISDLQEILPLLENGAVERI